MIKSMCKNERVISKALIIEIEIFYMHYIFKNIKVLRAERISVIYFPVEILITYLYKEILFSLKKYRKIYAILLIVKISWIRTIEDNRSERIFYYAVFRYSHPMI